MHCSYKNLFASLLQRALNMYSNSCVGFLVVESLHIARALACDNRFIWSGVYFLVLGKLEVWNSAFWGSKQFFLVCTVLQKRFSVGRNLGPVVRNLGFACHFSSLTITSLLSGRIFDTICLEWCPPASLNEWDEAVLSLSIKCGNSCGWKSMEHSCSIKDLTVQNGGGFSCSALLAGFVIHVKRSDLFPNLSFLNSDRDGG